MRTFLLVLAGLMAGQAEPCLSAQEYKPGQYEGTAQATRTQTGQRSAAQRIFELANQARAAAGADRLEWDSALAQAALAHCRRMVANGAIAHQYAGEADAAGRAGQAGAHFDLVEENVAVGQSPEEIHEAWMHSPGHRSNLLSPEVDRVGVAVVETRGVLYAVADYSRGVTELSAGQVEARVAQLIRKQSRVEIARDAAGARAACAVDKGFPGTGARPGFIMRWQDSELKQLPPALSQKLATGQYQSAAVGSCAPHGEQGAFTAYRVAVVLYLRQRSVHSSHFARLSSGEGTLTDCIPAAAAAWIPISVSSNTRQSAGATPRRAAATR
jgi:uncharacterized protein YkwD